MRQIILLDTETTRLKNEQKVFSQMRAANLNKLPFLQAQVLQQVLTDLHKNKQTTLDELSEIAVCLFSRDSGFSYIWITINVF